VWQHGPSLGGTGAADACVLGPSMLRSAASAERDPPWYTCAHRHSRLSMRRQRPGGLVSPG
jgi:hypothetical protein